MLELKLLRYGSGPRSTGGALLIDNVFHCHTCEDEYRAVKVPNETRIPAGRYNIKLRHSGGMNQKYTDRFSFHRGMLHLQDVPGFEWIYIHIGNNEKQTSGCILVGYTANSKGGFDVARSEAAYTDLYKIILAAYNRGESVFIEVIDL